MARFRLLTDHFIEPDLHKAGTVIDYDGPPNEGMEPLDEEATKQLDAYFAKNPRASLNPVDQLPRTMAVAVAVEPEAPGVRKVSAPSAGGN